MNYIEISKFCQFIKQKRSSKRVREGHAGTKSFYSEINGYDIKPVLREMQLNFSENWHNERVVNQLNRDYEKYLEIIEANFKPVSAGDFNLLNRKKIQLQKQLNFGSFLDPSQSLKISTSPEIQKEKESYKEMDLLWFQVGLKFATGEINQLPFNELSTPKIRKALKLPPGADKYLLATMQDYRETNKDKNIFASKKKMDIIANYCTSEKINIDEAFTSKLNLLKKKLI